MELDRWLSPKSLKNYCLIFEGSVEKNTQTVPRDKSYNWFIPYSWVKSIVDTLDEKSFLNKFTEGEKEEEEEQQHQQQHRINCTRGIIFIYSWKEQKKRTSTCKYISDISIFFFPLYTTKSWFLTTTLQLITINEKLKNRN